MSLQEKKSKVEKDIADISKDIDNRRKDIRKYIESKLSKVSSEQSYPDGWDIWISIRLNGIAEAQKKLLKWNEEKERIEKAILLEEDKKERNRIEAEKEAKRQLKEQKEAAKRAEENRIAAAKAAKEAEEARIAQQEAIEKQLQKKEAQSKIEKYTAELKRFSIQMNGLVQKINSERLIDSNSHIVGRMQKHIDDVQSKIDKIKGEIETLKANFNL